MSRSLLPATPARPGVLPAVVAGLVSALAAGLFGSRARGAALLAAFCGATGAAGAAVPLPDHVLYGTIAIQGRPVTRADVDVVVEARRTPNGPVLASYRMGSIGRLGEFYYTVRLPVAAAGDATDAQAVLGEPVVVSVRSRTGTAFQVNHTVTEPGTALRLDFGAGVDTNGDGVPEGWELAQLGTSGGNLQRDTDGDGAPDRAEYVAGTRPTASSESFRLAVLNDGEALQVSFRALRASGTGFEGRTRYYALETASDARRGPWVPVVNLSRIPGGDQLVTFATPTTTNALAFFRARVWLE